MNILNPRLRRKNSAPVKHSLVGLLTEIPPTLTSPETVAGQYLYRRYAIRPALADVIATCAGLGEREVRA